MILFLIESSWQLKQRFFLCHQQFVRLLWWSPRRVLRHKARAPYNPVRFVSGLGGNACRRASHGTIPGGVGHATSAREKAEDLVSGLRLTPDCHQQECRYDQYCQSHHNGSGVNSGPKDPRSIICYSFFSAPSFPQDFQLFQLFFGHFSALPRPSPCPGHRHSPGPRILKLDSSQGQGLRSSNRGIGVV